MRYVEKQGVATKKGEKNKEKKIKEKREKRVTFD